MGLFLLLKCGGMTDVIILSCNLSINLLKNIEYWNEKKTSGQNPYCRTQKIHESKRNMNWYSQLKMFEPSVARYIKDVKWKW